MKKGCTVMLVGWLVLVGGYGYVAWQRIPDTFPALIIGLLGGTFTLVFISSFIGLFTGGADRRALSRATNMDAPRDGRLEAASGQIRSVGAPLEAPFTGRPCVAYEYDVKQPGAGASEFAGFALAPCAIQTLRGPVRVFGWAMLDQFPAAESSAIDRARGAAYLEKSTFEKLGVTSMLSVLSELLADDDGSIRKDLRIDGDVAALQVADALRGRDITERIVPVDATVTMLGKWSEARQGFAPGGSTSVNRIFAADLVTTRQQIGGNSVKTFAAGTFFFVAMHAFLVPMYYLAPGRSSSGTSASKVKPSVLDERDCDRQKAALAAGADPNEVGDDRLTPLMNAAREGEPACVKNLVDAGAKLEMADIRGDTAMTQAITAGRDDSVEILRAAGAKDFRVTSATGQPIAADAPPLAAVKDYIAAVQRGDFPTMATLMLGTSLKSMEDRKDDLSLWQSMRPKDSDLTEGWMTDDAATLTMRGTMPKGPIRISYHVLRRPEGWRIRHEWFPDLK